MRGAAKLIALVPDCVGILPMMTASWLLSLAWDNSSNSACSSTASRGDCAYKKTPRPCVLELRQAWPVMYVAYSSSDVLNRISTPSDYFRLSSRTVWVQLTIPVGRSPAVVSTGRDTVQSELLNQRCIAEVFSEICLIFIVFYNVL